MKIAAVQIDPKLGEVDFNRAVLLREAESAIEQGAQLLVFPECAITGYCFNSKDEAMEVAELLPGETSGAVVALCAKHRVTIVYGTLQRTERDELFNAAVVCGPDGVAGIYHKTHLPTLGVDRFATPGAGPLAVYDTTAGKVGPAICYDARFPEPSRVLALNGAEIIALPTNWPEGSEKVPEYVVRTRALENCCYFVAVNRCGTEAGFTFVGRSTIAGPDGTILAQAAADRPVTIYADVDVALAQVKDVVVQPGAHEFHFWADRRPDLYGSISSQ